MKIYLVGGAVRDELLQQPIRERDWLVVGATAKQMLDLGYQQVGKDFPVFLHPDSKEEYALARTERKSASGHTGFDCFSSPDVTLEEDLLRRDLTINAIAKTDDGELIDPYGGRKDIEQRLLRHVSAAFTEDPLRVLRVARFMARFAHLGFSIAEETLGLMRAISLSGELTTLPAERLWKEFCRALECQAPSQFLISLQACAALPQLMPELQAPPVDNSASATNDDDSRYKHALNALQVASKETNDSRIRFACLLQGFTSDAIKQLCQRLRAPNEYRELALLVSQWRPAATDQPLNAATQLNTLERTDAFRRQQRFQLFLQACDIIHGDQQCSTALNAAFDACKAINLQALAEQYKGKEIAHQVQQHRLQAISSITN